MDLARSIARALAGSSRAARRPARRRRRVDPRVSGSHPDDRDPQTLDATIGRLVSEQGWGTEVRVHGVFTRWPAIVGPEVAQHVHPESFAPGEPGPAPAADGGSATQGGQDGAAPGPAARVGGRLVVRTDSTAWATQMRLLAPRVVRRLNEVLGDGTVAVIEVLGPRGPTWTKGRRAVRDGRGPRDTYG